MSDKSLSGSNIFIRIQESSPSRIIVSALQVVQPCLSIVVIPAVAERIINRRHILGRTIDPCEGIVTPRVIGVRQRLLTVLVIDRDDITLEVFLEIEGVKLVGVVAARPVLHSNGEAAFVVQVDQEFVAPGLADDPGAVQGIDMLNVVDFLAGTDSVGVEEPSPQYPQS